MEEQVLLDWVREHDMLLNKKSPGYKDTDKKEDCWGEIVSMMNREPE